jgi:hypothetical protein
MHSDCTIKQASLLSYSSNYKRKSVCEIDPWNRIFPYIQHFLIIPLYLLCTFLIKNNTTLTCLPLLCHTKGCLDIHHNDAVHNDVQYNGVKPNDMSHGVHTVNQHETK